MICLKSTPPRLCGFLRTLLLFFGFSFLRNFAHAQPELGLTPVLTTGLSEPIQFVNAGDLSNRVFIVQKGGTVRCYNSAFTFLSTFVTVPNVLNDGEQGLLSMAFHPNYSANGLFFVYYVNGSGNLELARFQVGTDPNVADPSTEEILLTIPHPTFGNHNGGELHFGIDGFLYLSTGDGGSSGDPGGNAQNENVLLGKMLRLEVNTSTTPPFYTIPAGNPFGNEVYELGLRNPFRWSFDRLTNDMWIGDVGQDSWEEINYRPAGAPAGTNYGWRCYEGNNTFNTSGCGDASDYVFPAFTYPTQNPSASITGGVVYRGSIDALKGYYVSADFFSGIWYLVVPNGPGWTVSTQTITPNGIADFGETESGDLYAVSLFSESVSQVIVTGVLPLTLLDFKGAPQVQGVELKWTTAQEQNVDRFEVEYSLDGFAFTKATSVLGRNETSTTTAYQYYHPIVYNGIVFYRLKMVDRDGRSTYSSTIKLSLQMQSDKLIVPSVITNGTIVARLPAGVEYRFLEVVALDGRSILKADLKGRNGSISLPIAGAAKGIYVVRVMMEQGMQAQKITIQ